MFIWVGAGILRVAYAQHAARHHVIGYADAAVHLTSSLCST